MIETDWKSHNWSRKYSFFSCLTFLHPRKITKHCDIIKIDQLPQIQVIGNVFPFSFIFKIKKRTNINRSPIFEFSTSNEVHTRPVTCCIMFDEVL